MEWMLMPLYRYADFSGRSRRKEYWMFFLGLLLVGIVIGILGAILGGGVSAPPRPMMGPLAMMSGVSLGLFGILWLAIIIPSIAVQVRRFHDQDKSGWFVLLGFIPYVGAVIVLVFMCLEGTRGPNRFGPDPKGNVPRF